MSLSTVFILSMLFLVAAIFVRVAVAELPSFLQQLADARKAWNAFRKGGM